MNETEENITASLNVVGFITAFLIGVFLLHSIYNPSDEMAACAWQIEKKAHGE